jgi:hypothetical protein
LKLRVPKQRPGAIARGSQSTPPQDGSRLTVASQPAELPARETHGFLAGAKCTPKVGRYYEHGAPTK